MPPDGISDGWPEWAKYVLETLKELKSDIAGLVKAVTELQVAITQRATVESVQRCKDDVLMLKTKAGVWGALGGALFGLVAGIGGQLIVWLIKGGP